LRPRRRTIAIAKIVDAGGVTGADAAGNFSECAPRWFPSRQRTSMSADFPAAVLNKSNRARLPSRDAVRDHRRRQGRGMGACAVIGIPKQKPADRSAGFVFSASRKTQ
jgi:hypothetical protein